MDLLEFIYNSNKLNNMKELRNYFLEFLKPLGLNYFTFANMSPTSIAQKNENFDILTNYPESWLLHYKSQNYALYDPIYQAVYKINTPYTWEEIYKWNPTQKSKHIMAEAKDNSLVTGIGIPLHCSAGHNFGLSLSSSCRDIRHDRNFLCLCNAAANQFLVVFEDLNHILPCKHCILLTRRESEILQWISTGRTKSEVADILVISESCIKRHCENIFLKLNVRNLPAAVTKAIRLGQIDL